MLVSPCGSLERSLGNLSDHVALFHVEKLLGKKRNSLSLESGDYIVL